MASRAVPLFVYADRDLIPHVCLAEGRRGCEAPSRFDAELRSGWAAKMRQGLFRYQLGELQSRVIPGPLGFVAQLNVPRGKERRKPQHMHSLQQAFDDAQFNFNKIRPEEILFALARDDHPRRVLVVINVSPLEFGHCLLIPEPSHCLPQVLTPHAICTAIESVLLSSTPAFRVGFNSPGAFASVNHLHLHGYYLDHHLRVESVPTKPLLPSRGLFGLLHFPPGFLLYTEGHDLPTKVNTASQLTGYLVERNVAHNMFVTRGSPPEDTCGHGEAGVRAIIWPRRACFGAKEECAFNVALCELAGHLPFKSREEFDTLSEGDVVDIIHKHLLPEDEFERLQNDIVRYLQEIAS